MYRSFVVTLLLANVIYGSQDTIGPNGINSSGLGLDGSGQVETSRAGRPQAKGVSL